MKKLLIAFAMGGCASSGPSIGPPAADPGFVAAARAAIEHLVEMGAGAHPVEVDPRPIAPDARGVTHGLLDDPPTAAIRSRALADAGLAEGDVVEAMECNHVGGMGGLMIPPLTEEQEALFERCRAAFRGLTLVVSVPVPLEGGARRYRVLAYGSDSVRGWDMVVDADGAVVSVHRFMFHIS